MSVPNPKVENALYHVPAKAFHPNPPSGTAGIRGLSFAYRLNAWGAKNGPAMIPANDYPHAFLPDNTGLSGLSSPLTWMQSLVGMESVPDILTDASNNLADAVENLEPIGSQIQTLLQQAQAYGNATDATIQQKSQATQSEAAGLLSAMATLQNTAATFATAIQNAKIDTATDKTTAQNLKDQTDAFASQVSDFVKSISQLQSDVLALAKYAQSGPSTIQAIEGSIGATVKTSVSTLTWILGGGALVYFLAPTFIPRMVSGIRKSR